MVSPKLQKISFFIILFLLLLFLPLTGYSMYLKMTYVKPDTTLVNENKEMFYAGKLWFYDDLGKLLGTYDCQNEYCAYGSSFSEDDQYAIDFYKTTNETYLPIINNRFVFIKDEKNKNSHELSFLDLQQPSSYKGLKYTSVKNYQVGLEDNLYIIQNKEKKYGVLQINTMPMSVIAPTYDFIGVVNQLNDNKHLIADYFVALKDQEWMIIDKNDAKLTDGITDEIVNFNGSYVITQDENQLVHVVNYKNEMALEGDYVSLSFVGKYLFCQTEQVIYLYDLARNELVSAEHEVGPTDTFMATITDSNVIEISINDEVVEKI